MEQDLKSLLSKQFSDYTERSTSSDMLGIHIPCNRHRSYFETLRNKLEFEYLTDVTALDWNEDTPRFTVVYHLYHLIRKTYLRVAVDCQDDEEPVVPTVSDLWPTADWHEREVYDMFGIHFSGHPNLKRILMWDGYPYFPLRKEFPLAGHEVELPAPDVSDETGAQVEPAPMMGGPFVSSQKGHMSDREPRAGDESWTEKNEKPDDLPENKT